MKINNLKYDLINALEKTSFSQKNIVLLHVKLKNIQNIYNLPYDKITSIIIEVLNGTKPENIIVPSFTHNFTKNKIFDIKNSKSEVGIFSEIFRKNYIGLDHLIASQIHYIEYTGKVPYRSEINKEGYIIDNNNKNYKINYNFYARVLENKLGLDWNKIEKLLIKEGKLYFINNCPLSLKWLKVKEITNVIIPEIKKNPFYLVKKIEN